MKVTFGIITDGNSWPNVEHVLWSIEQLRIPDESYEVIVVGGNQNVVSDNGLVKMIAFDETKKKAWITRKKNLITENARFENIVYTHDYIKFNAGWYEDYCNFGNGFDVCMNPILNADGERYRDWTLWPDDLTHIIGTWDGQYLLPYDVTDLSKFMYFSGAYWVAKKSVMERFPLDEALSWGESEDVKWSKQVREHYNFSINPKAHVQLLKQKERIFSHVSPERIKLLRTYANLQTQ